MAQEWLVSKGVIADDKVTFKRFLHRMWFALYPRSVLDRVDQKISAKVVRRELQMFLLLSWLRLDSEHLKT